LIISFNNLKIFLTSFFGCNLNNKKMSKIYNYVTKKLITEDKKLSIKELVEKAVKEKINLSDADLSDAFLSGADLSEGADLRGANLEDAFGINIT